MSCSFAVFLVGALAAIQTNDCSRPGEICEISTAGQGFKHDTAVVHDRRNLRGDLISVDGTCDSNLNCVATGGSSNCPVDIIFVLDGSTSISSSSWDSLIAACEQVVHTSATYTHITSHYIVQTIICLADGDELRCICLRRPCGCCPICLDISIQAGTAALG